MEREVKITVHDNEQDAAQVIIYADGTLDVGITSFTAQETRLLMEALQIVHGRLSDAKNT